MLTHPALTGLRTELGQIIMIHIHIADGPLLDVPRALTAHSDPNGAKMFRHDWLWLRNDKFKVEPRSLLHFQLYSEILCVCREFNMEGTPLPYGKNNLRACIALYIGSSNYSYSYRHLSCCMGVEAGISAALAIYWALQRISNWNYQIRIGPDDDRNGNDVASADRCTVISRRCGNISELADSESFPCSSLTCKIAM